MLITQLTGGIGNQMFQYAASKAQANRLGTGLYLDKTHFQTTPLGKKNLRQYELDVFNIKESFKSPAFHWVKKYLKTAKVYAGFDTFKEKHVHVHQDFFDIKDNTYIEGFFQSEKYFKEFEKEIRKDLTFRTELQDDNQSLFKKIKTVNAISLHVRRGDYVSNSETNQTHGVCSLEYYQKAISKIESKVSTPYFFLFSDEPEWVQQNLKLTHPFKIVNHNEGENSFEDMRLMSNCQHHIIANSSFSWWGAWLNNNKNKIVIAPKEWFADKKHDTSDIIPNTWLKV